MAANSIDFKAAGFEEPGCIPFYQAMMWTSERRMQGFPSWEIIPQEDKDAWNALAKAGHGTPPRELHEKWFR